MITSLGPRLSSSFSSLVYRTASDEKLDESLGPRLVINIPHYHINSKARARLLLPGNVLQYHGNGQSLNATKAVKVL